MITRTLELTEDVERKLQLASAAYKMSGTGFIKAAIETALACSAAEVPAIAKAFELAAV
jgi:hypothetical protein